MSAPDIGASERSGASERRVAQRSRAEHRSGGLRSGAEWSTGASERRVAQRRGAEHWSIGAQGCAAERKVEHRIIGASEHRSAGLLHWSTEAARSTLKI